MNKYLKRLLKLAKHLESGKLGHDEFYFGCYHYFCEQNCKTIGCAIGECPTIWPREWEIARNPLLKVTSGDTFEDTMKFFNVGYLECNHLFHHNRQYPESFGGKNLGISSTRKEVAKNIREFVKRKLQK